MKKRFTFTLMGFLLLLGGVSIQAQTVNLPIKGGYNWEAWAEKSESGASWGPSDDGHYSGVIRFKDNSPKYCRIGGKEWATSYNSSQQTITATLNNYFYNQYNNIESSLATKFILVAVKGGEYSGNDLTGSDTYNWNNNSFKDGDGTSAIKVVATSGEQSVFDANHQLILTININEDYDAIYLCNIGDGGWKFIKIESITRTISSASSVASPTISPSSGSYDGELSVTITPDAENDKVIYSVSGSDQDASNVEITSETILNLTGTGTITITATGYKNDEASNPVTNTYTYGISSGKNVIASYNSDNTFTGWGNNKTINQSNFSGLKMNDYVILNVRDVANNGTLLGFRCDNNGWQESPYVDCKTVSSGNGAKGTFNVGDTQWWLKVSNEDVLNAFKNHQTIIQGGVDGDNNQSSITLNSVETYESQAISELVDNTIASKINNVVVELTRSLVADNWNTICLPFALTSAQATQLFGSGYQLAAFTGVSGTTMQFTTTGTFEAGMPYLVKPKINVSNANPVVLVDVNITAKTPQTVTKSGYSFVGNFTQKSFNSGERSTTRFVGAGNTLLKPNDESAMKSLRCYFVVPAKSAARSFTIDGMDDSTTSISGMSEATTTNYIYDLSGRQVVNPVKGLYIVNGRKVVIK